MNPDLHIVKTEVYDVEMMDAILKDTEVFIPADLKRLSMYKRSSKISTNSVEVVYHYGKGCEINQLGRLYTRGNIGLQAYPRGIRNPLLKKYYFDIDMENAHFNLMIKLGLEWGIITTNIKYYCEHRNECLTMLGTNRTISKTAYLKVAYGGNIKLHDENINDDGLAPDGDLTMLKKIEVEVGNMMDMCYLKFFDKYKSLVSKKDNPKASLFALILQTEERKCLMALDEYLKNNNRSADILIHDGLEVRKLENETIFPEALLKGGEKAIFDKTGHTVKLAEKEIEHNYVIKKELIINYDDDYAAGVFVKLMDDNIKRDGNTVYYYDDKIGMWNCSDEAFKRNVNKFKNDLIFVDKNTGHKYNYGGNTVNVSLMQKWLLVKIEDDNFFKKSIDNSIGKLLFLDGIYDFVTDTFKEGFDKNIIFLKRIKRKYPKIVNEKLVNEVNNILFVSAFDTNDDKSGLSAGEYLKKSLAMAIFGDYFRKKFYINVGLANCGKGLLVYAMKKCFEEFIGEFDANNLVYNKNCSSDEAKRLSWLAILHGCRVVFSNEIRILLNKLFAMDGNLIKSLASGGDEFSIRENFENIRQFIVRFTCFMLGNDIPPIEPVDSGIIVRCSYVRYKLSFVNNPTEPNQRLADTSVKGKFNDDDYKNALFHLIRQTYISLLESEKKIGGHIVEPSSVTNETKNWIISEDDVFKQILSDNFIITNCDLDHVQFAIISKKFNDNKLTWTDKKLSMNLKNLITLSEDSSRKYKGSYHMYGIKLIEPVNEIEEKIDPTVDF